jgi:Tat protein secretion system quality control protein TatD with DNase activity
MNITKKHYTADGRHPEDVIYQEKEYINRLQQHIDEAFEKMAAKLNLNETGIDWVFDYVYNEDRDVEFEDVLEKAGLTYDEIVNKYD